jgi:hypothetical protein
LRPPALSGGSYPPVKLLMGAPQLGEGYETAEKGGKDPWGCEDCPNAGIGTAGETPAPAMEGLARAGEPAEVEDSEVAELRLCAVEGRMRVTERRLDAFPLTWWTCEGRMA